MQNFPARTEINDAWTNQGLATAFMKRGKLLEAQAALADAERHYKCAIAAIQHPNAITDKLFDLRMKMDQTRSELRSELAKHND